MGNTPSNNENVSAAFLETVQKQFLKSMMQCGGGGSIDQSVVITDAQDISDISLEGDFKWSTSCASTDRSAQKMANEIARSMDQKVATADSTIFGGSGAEKNYNEAKVHELIEQVFTRETTAKLVKQLSIKQSVTITRSKGVSHVNLKATMDIVDKLLSENEAWQRLENEVYSEFSQGQEHTKKSPWVDALIAVGAIAAVGAVVYLVVLRPKESQGSSVVVVAPPATAAGPA